MYQTFTDYQAKIVWHLVVEWNAKMADAWRWVKQAFYVRDAFNVNVNAETVARWIMES